MSRLSEWRARSAFTLVELLVVIAIIGILVAMLLPAIQAAREAGRRSTCQNNLKQIGLALQNYHDIHETFPTSSYLKRPIIGSTDVGAFHHTWLTSTLPFMEQKQLHDKIDFRIPAWGQAIVGTRLGNLICPSDGGYQKPEETHGIAFTTYAGSEGYHWWETAALDPAWGGAWTQIPVLGDYSGLFAVNRTFDMAGISDGTSNTVVVAETDSYGYKWGAFQTTGGGKRRLRGGEAVFRSAFIYTSYTGYGKTAPHKKPDDSGPEVDGAWFRAGPHSYPPSYLTAWGINTEWPGAGSSHGDFVLGVRADGSVGYYRETIPWGLWVAVNGVADTAPAKIDN